MFGPVGEPVPDPRDPRLTVRSGEGLRLIEVGGPGHSVLTVKPVQRARELVAVALDEAFATPNDGADGTGARPSVGGDTAQAVMLLAGDLRWTS